MTTTTTTTTTSTTTTGNIPKLLQLVVLIAIKLVTPHKRKDNKKAQV